VTITRTDLESPSGKSLGTRTVAANGSFSFTDTTSAGGRVTYRASYAGDEKHSAVTATKSVTVSRTPTTLSLTNVGKVYGYGKRVTFTARLGATYKNRTVEIWADPTGRDQGPPKTVSATAGTKVNVSLKLSKWRAWGDGYFPAARAIYLSGAGSQGYKMRVRAAYVKCSSNRRWQKHSLVRLLAADRSFRVPQIEHDGRRKSKADAPCGRFPHRPRTDYFFLGTSVIFGSQPVLPNSEPDIFGIDEKV